MHEAISSIASNDRGSAMVFALVVLVVLTVLGVSAMNTTQTELQIAANDLRHKIAFYQADGGTEIGTELIEQNIACPQGFTGTTRGDADNTMRIQVEDGSTAFWLNQDDDATEPTDVNRDFFFPSDYTGSQPHTNVKLGGNSQHSTGSALQILAGYEGKGKALASGGAFINYDLISQHVGNFNTESVVRVQWRHVIGTEGVCSP